MKPSYVLVRDRQLQAVVLAIRGTHSFKDMFTSLTGGWVVCGAVGCCGVYCLCLFVSNNLKTRMIS